MLLLSLLLWLLRFPFFGWLLFFFRFRFSYLVRHFTCSRSSLITDIALSKVAPSFSCRICAKIVYEGIYRVQWRRSPYIYNTVIPLREKWLFRLHLLSYWKLFLTGIFFRPALVFYYILEKLRKIRWLRQQWPTSNLYLINVIADHRIDRIRNDPTIGP